MAIIISFLESGLAVICFVQKMQWKTLASSEPGPQEILHSSTQSLGILPASKQTTPGHSRKALRRVGEPSQDEEGHPQTPERAQQRPDEPPI